MQTKKCFKCGEVKSLSMFYKAKQNKDGYAGVCKVCKDIQTRDYYIKKFKISEDEWIIRKEKAKERLRKRRSEYAKKYYIKNKEKINANEKERRNKMTKEERQKLSREYYLKYKETHLSCAKRQIENLTDSYISHFLNLKKDEWIKYNSIIELKRNSIRGKRILKELCQ